MRALKRQTVNTFLKVLWVFCIMACTLLVCSAHYLLTDWGEMKFETVVYQLTSPLQGTNREIIQAYLIKAALPALVFWVLLWIWCAASRRFFTGNRKRMRSRINVGVSLLWLVLLLQKAWAVGLPEYITESLSESRIFETYYVDPGEVAITFGEKKNLLYIYLESMEHTYASVEEGGGKDRNYIPGLTALAKEHISFSDSANSADSADNTDSANSTDSAGNTDSANSADSTDSAAGRGDGWKLGGLHMSTGSGWTMAGLLAQSTGLPYQLPIGEAMGTNGEDAYLPGVTALGDILRKQGYRGYFMCGSVAEFGGRRSYFEQHGAYEILDYDRAVKDGLIPDDYLEFWGFEDRKLYRYARETLRRIADEEEPFHFTMLTVDSHHPEGYLCELCPRGEAAYPDKYGNAIACSDRQILQFLEWVQAQSWYEDTVVVVAGDHLSMNATFFRDLPEGFERRVYNCILNTDREPVLPADHRIACTLDMFPTVLAAMGAEIEGERLGLGTNLFSGRPTLAEELGPEEFNRQLAGKSEFYRENFLE